MKRSSVVRLALVALLFAALPAHGQVATETVTYTQGDTTLKGYLAYPEDVEGKRPGVLVFPEWWGLNDYAKMRARQLAELGYIALAADVYGQGQTTEDPQEAGRLASTFRNDRQLARSRAQAALDTLRDQKQVDPQRIAAIGYCFGGGIALELARSGADIDGVVSFHGSLGNPNPQDVHQIKASLLILHGAADPHVPEGEVLSFIHRLADTDVDWQFIAFSDAVHAFTNPDAGDDPSDGTAYDPQAAERAWDYMRLFLDEVLSPAHSLPGPDRTGDPS